MVNATRPQLRIRPLTTSRLELTPLDPHADASALHAMFADPAVHRYDVDARVSESVEETESRLRLQVVANAGATWAIRLTGGPPIGTIGVFADQGTTIRGVGWSLTSTYWRQGLTTEAARAAVPFLLAQAGVDAVEAWMDSANVGSIAVARAAGMQLAGRLPRVYPDRVAQTVVMVRPAVAADPEVFGTFSSLIVTDLAATLDLLRSLFQLHIAWAVPDPPTMAFLAFEPWSGSLGFLIEQTGGSVTVQEMSFDVGIAVDEVRSRVARAGLTVDQEPTDQAWFRRELSFRLPDGHLIRVSGPSSPPDRH